jgi:SAM-dependent methyltransferase
MTGARESLKKTLDIDPSVFAAKHMLKALSLEDSLTAITAEEEYVKELFNIYAETYDKHGKKLLYSAPRIIRQELAKVYKNRFDSGDVFAPQPGKTNDIIGSVFHNTNIYILRLYRNYFELIDSDSVMKGEKTTVGGNCSPSYPSFVNNSMDVLDIGCGTGLAGAWLKDYAKTLTGVGNKQ